MSTLDLDRARAEAGAATHDLVFGGVTYTFPAKLPLLVIEQMERHEFTAAIQTLAGEQPGEALMKAGFAVDELVTVLEAFYDFTGEAAASSGS